MSQPSLRVIASDPHATDRIDDVSDVASLDHELIQRHLVGDVVQRIGPELDHLDPGAAGRVGDADSGVDVAAGGGVGDPGRDVDPGAEEVTLAFDRAALMCAAPKQQQPVDVARRVEDGDEQGHSSVGIGTGAQHRVAQ